MRKVTIFVAYQLLLCHAFSELCQIFVFCMILGKMSSGDFYGPALPPGFVKGTSDSPSAEVLPRSGRSRKRHHSSSSDTSSSSSSSHDSDRANSDRCKLSEKDSEKDGSKSSERLFGPALPAGFSPADEIPSKESSFIGPVLPSTATTASIRPAGDDNDDDNDGFGPSPALKSETKMQSTVEEIESRAKMMKDKLEGKVLCFSVNAPCFSTCVLCFCILLHFYAVLSVGGCIVHCILCPSIKN